MSKNKREYQKPQLERVKLVLDEVVLSNCKAVMNDPAGVGNKYCGHNQCKGVFGS